MKICPGLWVYEALRGRPGFVTARKPDEVECTNVLLEYSAGVEDAVEDDGEAVESVEPLRAKPGVGASSSSERRSRVKGGVVEVDKEEAGVRTGGESDEVAVVWRAVLASESDRGHRGRDELSCCCC